MGPSEGRLPPDNAANRGADAGTRPASQPRSRGPEEEAPRFTRDDQVPDAPPASVWREVDRAAEMADQLLAGGQELCFEPDPATGRVAILVRDRHSNVVRLLSPSEALAIASGSDGLPGMPQSG